MHFYSGPPIHILSGVDTDSLAAASVMAADIAEMPEAARHSAIQPITKEVVNSKRG
jgi:hypothetical protein